MPRLFQTARAYGTPEFESTLKREIAALGPDVLGLQRGLTSGSVSLGKDLGVMLLGVSESADAIRIRAGIFFTSVLSGCACADDPTPENENSEYCEIEVEIHRSTGHASLRPS